MWYCTGWQNFTKCWWNLLLPSATIKPEAICAFKTWVNMSQKTMIFVSLLWECQIPQITELQCLPKSGYINTDGPLLRITPENSAVVLMFLPFTLTNILQFFPNFCKPLLSFCKDWASSCNKNLYTLLPYSTEQSPSQEANRFQLVKKSPIFYGNRGFITAFTSTRHLSLSSASSIQSITPHPTFWRSIFILPPIYAWVSQVVSFPQGSPPKPCIHPSSPPCRLHTLPISFSSILSPE